MNGPDGKRAWMVKIGEKGQFVIPKEARELFGFQPGDTVLVLGDPEKGLAIPEKSLRDRQLAALFAALEEESEATHE